MIFEFAYIMHLLHYLTNKSFNVYTYAVKNNGFFEPIETHIVLLEKSNLNPNYSLFGTGLQQNK